jgi:hypothetical protein
MNESIFVDRFKNRTQHNIAFNNLPVILGNIRTA